MINGHSSREGAGGFTVQARTRIDLLVLLGEFSMSKSAQDYTPDELPMDSVETRLPEADHFDQAETWGVEFLADETADWEEAVDDSDPTALATESEDEFVSFSVSEETEASDESIVASASVQTLKIALFKVKNWPEFKVEMKKKCRRVLGRKICVNVPQAYQRNCELKAFAEIKLPSANQVKRKIESCVKKAVAAGVLAGIYTGNIAAATAALKLSLQACLKSEGVQSLNQLSVKVRTEKKCGKWKPR
ncbi:hypothetical protein M4951_16425 [Blastopirellula sp. J2-11]|uniref:hypothetical protein n=1 Tax=Blastopirellula sp. J2-11 TaxID=2943192 RepID=UPI0021CADBB2|nr:hypothetical protein [Blastopirellula sp. J2-11]UUO04966.1 hypothetical protein M4951_16425 [Blastopirellula sp. J2-11]